MSQREPVTVNFEQDLYNFLRHLADQRGLPLGVYTRQLVVKGLVQDLSDYNSWKYFKANIEDMEKL